MPWLLWIGMSGFLIGGFLLGVAASPYIDDWFYRRKPHWMYTEESDK